MKLTYVMMAITAAAFSYGAAAQDFIPVDDSYTVSQRYSAYKKDYPELKWPRLQLETGQQILFDRLYKMIGTRELHIDIFLPAPDKTTHRAILFVHGGGWSSGNKSHFYTLANLLAQRGYVVLLPEYRLAPEAKYPAGLVDINDAIVWAKSQAKMFGFDADKLALGGASSGGQMAALLAFSASQGMFPVTKRLDTRVCALIDLDGVLDMTTPLALENENAAGEQSPMARWIGGSFETAGNRWREASAARYVNASSPPSLIISSGMPRFTAGREAVARVLESNHVRHAFFSLVHAPHTFWLFDPYVSEIARRIDAFLAPTDKSGTANH